MHHAGDVAVDADTSAPGWRALNFGISWEGQGIRNWERAWLRQEALIPEELRGKSLFCEFRLLAQSVELYFNGRSLGRVEGSMQRARFYLPRGEIIWGRRNSIALKVDGHQWSGGVPTDYFVLLCEGQPLPDVTIGADFEKADHVIADGSSVTLSGAIALEGVDGIAGTLRLRLENDFHQVLLDRSQPFEMEAEGAEWSIGPGRLPPGFYRLSVQFDSPLVHSQKLASFAVEPENIPSTPSPEPDAAAYWQRARAELATVAPDFVLIEEPEKSTERHKVYTVQMQSLDGVTLRGWYVVPRAASGPCPAVLDLPGYGFAWQPEYVMGEDDVIHLALDIRGQGRSADVVRPGFGMPGQVHHNVLEPEKYFYRQAYMDCGRALEFLHSRPEVDKARVAVSGSSQGGGLAFASAALFPDMVAYCVAAVPYLGNFGEHIRLREVYEWEMRQYLEITGQSGRWPELVRTMNYVDTMNLAASIRCPVLMMSALLDDDCPPRIGFAVYNLLEGRKEYKIFPESAHIIGEEGDAYSRDWLRRQFGLADE